MSVLQVAFKRLSGPVEPPQQLCPINQAIVKLHINLECGKVQKTDIC